MSEVGTGIGVVAGFFANVGIIEWSRLNINGGRVSWDFIIFKR